MKRNKPKKPKLIRDKTDVALILLFIIAKVIVYAAIVTTPA